MIYTHKSKKLKIHFRKLENVNNPNSIHGIYPYRGKISPIDVIQVLQQLPKRGTLLDPFCGTGTIIYEAKKLGFDVIGVDSNPIAIQISNAKFSKLNIDESVTKISQLVPKNTRKKPLKLPDNAQKYFHDKTASEIMTLLKDYELFTDYEKAAFLGAICLSARGCNHYKWTSTQIGKISEDKKYINFYEKFINKIKKHHFPIEINGSQIISADSRKLGNHINKGSVNYVYTSPPYFDALDYTSYYTRLIHYIFKNDLSKIKKNLIQNYASYEQDMKKCFNEIVKVTTNDALIIFVVGDKKKGSKIINGGEFFSNIYDIKPNFIIEREYTGTASKVWDKINKTQRKEQIIIWDKTTWE